MAFVCKDHDDFLSAVRDILSRKGRLYHTPQNSFIDKDGDQKLYYRKSWVAGKLRYFNQDNEFVKVGFLDVLKSFEEGREFKVAREGIHLQQFLDGVEKEMKIVETISSLVMDFKQKAVLIHALFNKLDDNLKAGRFFGNLQNLKNFLDFHSAVFEYQDSDRIKV